jgi:hypothetical protein
MCILYPVNLCMKWWIFMEPGYEQVFLQGSAWKVTGQETGKNTSDISLFILNGSSNEVTKNITNEMNSHGWLLSRHKTTQFCAVCLGCICFRENIPPLLELYIKVTQYRWQLSSFHFFFVFSIWLMISFSYSTVTVNKESVIKMYLTQYFR